MPKVVHSPIKGANWRPAETETKSDSFLSDTSVLQDKSNHLETPLGDRDHREKIQLCIEFREILKPKFKVFQLDVVVLQMRYLDWKTPGKPPLPYVKLRLLPADKCITSSIFCTELKESEKRNSYFYGEPFSFPMNKMSELTGKSLQVQVCDRKVTRRAECFGEVVISLDGLQVGKPFVEWHFLKK